MNSKYVLLGVLYFVQGIPYGLQSGLLPVYFRTAGLSLTKISLAKVLYVPWILKVVWAPLVDQYSSKRHWLLLTMGGFVLACLSCSLLAPETGLLPVAAVLLIMNVFASIQDIAVDSLAVQLLRQGEIGYGNAIQVVAYKLGSIVAGGGVLTFLHYLSWESLFRYLAVIYALAIAFTWASELSGRLGCLSRDRCARGRTLNPWHILQELLRVPDTSWTAGFVLIYKLGEQGAISMFPLFLLDRGFSPQRLGFWNGIVAMAFSIAGSSLGGHLMTKPRHPLPLLKTVLALRFGSLVFQTLLMAAYEENVSVFEAAAILSIFAQNFLAGLITTLTFSLMMSCSQGAKEQIQATHYSLLATLEVLGKLLLSALAGSLVDWLGFVRAFGLFLALSCSPIVYVLAAKR